MVEADIEENEGKGGGIRTRLEKGADKGGVGRTSLHSLFLDYIPLFVVGSVDGSQVGCCIGRRIANVGWLC